MNEFEIISTIFAPLASSAPGAFGLTDDAAVIEVAADKRMVASVDTVVADVHFFAADDPQMIARKGLRASLSDLAAMGAKPRGYLLALTLPRGVDEDWLRRFARGLAVDQAAYDCLLLGGDSVATAGPLTVSFTVLGEVPNGAELRRRGARIGDLVFLSGTVGEAALGLLARKGVLPEIGESSKSSLLARYHLPEPRLTLGQKLTRLAHSAVDISDGLIADLGHLCAVSGVGVVIQAGSLPLSPAVRAVLDAEVSLLPVVLTGGDDYELAFTVPGDRAGKTDDLARSLGVPITRIGSVVAESGVAVLDPNGKPMVFETGGYAHF